MAETIDTDRLASVLLAADRRTLSALVVHLSGDPTRVRPKLDRETLVEIAVPILTPYVTGEKQIQAPSPEVLQAAMELAAGEPVPPSYGKLALEQMGFERSSDQAPLNAPSGFSLIIIGTGLTGLLTAIMLIELGFHNFTILEKNDGPGGTWRQNTYPGCRVDTPSLLYSFSFLRDYPWPDHFSHQPVILDYLTSIVEKYELDKKISYQSYVESMAWDEAGEQWLLDVRRNGGDAEQIQANFVVGATGLLRVPSLPQIQGRDDFAGPSFHSTNWDHTVDLAGKRVAVIGTGASANQIVPAIAPIVDKLTVFQRSPQWMIPHPQYGKRIEGSEWTLVRDLPGYAAWYRFRQFWTLGDRSFALLKLDPKWPDYQLSVNSASEKFRQDLLEYIRNQLDDDEDLINKSTPDYPPFGKRMLIDNGWYQALKRSNVTLNVDEIERITPTGVRTVREDVDVDVLIFATGFYTDRVLDPIAIRGAGGVDVRARLVESPEAYLGMAIAHCPNLMVSPGPNGVPAHGGSGMFYAECHVGYIVACLRHMFDNGYTRMEVRPEAVDAFVADVVEELQHLVWSLPTVSNWFKGSRDRVFAVLPRRILDLWETTRRPVVSDYTWS